MAPACANAPILVFDSGVGGLSILAGIRILLPAAPVVYAMDSAGYPYGALSDTQIASRVPDLLGRLVVRYCPRLVVIACNTASTIALENARRALDVPVVGTVPAIKRAAGLSNSRVIGILGTQATVRQPYVDRLKRDFASDCTLLRHGAPALVDFAEARLRGETPQRSVVAGAVAGLLEQPRGSALDTVVLACTHFPLVQTELERVMPQRLVFVDGSQGIARRVMTLTRSHIWPISTPAGIVVTSGSKPDIKALAPALQRFGLCRIDLL